MGHVRTQLTPNRQRAIVGAPSARRRRQLNIQSMFLLAVGVIDVTAIAATGIAVSWHDLLAQSDTTHRYAYTLAVFAIVTLAFMAKSRLFSLVAVMHWQESVRKIVLSICGAGLLLVALAVGLDVAHLYAWPWFASLLSATALALMACRATAAAAIRVLIERGRLTREVAIVGATRQANLLVKRLQQRASPGTRILGVFDERRTRVPAEVRGIPLIGDIRALGNLVRRGMVDDVVLALPWNAEARVLELIDRLRPLPVNVSLAFDAIAYDLVADVLAARAELPVVNVYPAPLDGWRGIVKSIEDKLLALAALLALTPLMAIIATLIRLDSPGPVIFRQKRFGFNNEVIEIFKFRTMYDENETGIPFRQARRNDPRVTRIGRLLRRTSLDELPQLVNVLQGRMSLVGPRPHVGEIHDFYTRLINDYDARHKIKPGITGWAQINGCRGETDTIEKMEMRVELDIWYVENWSLMLDIRILLTTLVYGWTHKNAY